MGRGQRWQPPHPDPAKAQQPRRSRPELPFPDRALAAMEANEKQPGVFGERCLWPACYEYVEPNYGVHLCRDHAHEVRDVLNEHDAAYERRLDEVGADIAARRARAAEKLDAGRALARGDIAPGWVYYLAVDDLIKIGFAKDVPSRMRQYPPNAKLLAVEPGTRRVEHERHGTFHAHLAKGREWFHDAPEIRQWVDTVRAQFGSAEGHEWPWTEPTRSRQQIQPKRFGRAI